MNSLDVLLWALAGLLLMGILHGGRQGLWPLLGLTLGLGLQATLEQAALLPGIEARGFCLAFWAALLLAVLGMLIRGVHARRPARTRLKYAVLTQSITTKPAQD